MGPFRMTANLEGHQNGHKNITFKFYFVALNPNWRLKACIDRPQHRMMVADKLFVLELSKKGLLFIFAIGVKALK